MTDPATYLTRDQAEAITREVVASVSYPDTKLGHHTGPLGITLWFESYHRPNNVCPNGGKTALKQHVAIPWSILTAGDDLRRHLRRTIERTIREGEQHEVDEALKFDGVPVAWPHGEGAPGVPAGLGVTYEDAVRLHQESGKCDACNYEAHTAANRWLRYGGGNPAFQPNEAGFNLIRQRRQ